MICYVLYTIRNCTLIRVVYVYIFYLYIVLSDIVLVSGIRPFQHMHIRNNVDALSQSISWTIVECVIQVCMVLFKYTKHM
jgi:hypothetical protein